MTPEQKALQESCTIIKLARNEIRRLNRPQDKGLLQLMEEHLEDHDLYKVNKKMRNPQSL